MRAIRGSVAAALLLASGLALMASSAPAEISHGGVVPETPRLDTPYVVDGTVYDLALVGDKVVAGGDFTIIRQSAGGADIAQAYVMAYNINTGVIDPVFDPVLDGPVYEVEANVDQLSVFVGGTFNNVDGTGHAKIAKISMTTGEAVAGFTASTNAKVSGLAVGNGVVYLGGGFTQVNGVSRSHLGAVDAVTGALETNFDFPLTVPLGRSGSGSVRALDTTPDENTLLVVHASRYVASQERVGAALIDASGTPSLLPWETDLYEDNLCGSYVRVKDGEISPDGTYFVTVSQGGDNPPACDTAVAFPIAGGAGTEELWVTRNWDSTYSIGISDAAVYIGGHFCYTEGPGAEDPWPPESKPSPCGPTSQDVEDRIVARWQVAALDPVDGHALDWNPQANAFKAVYALEVIDRGLLLGHDRNQVGGYNVGRAAFFDLGGYTPPPGGDGTIAVVVANPASLNTSDQAMVDRLTARGFDVELHDDGAVMPADVAGRDGVWISTTVSSGAIGNRLASVPEPTAVSKPYLYDDMGLTGPTAGVDYDAYSTDSITVTTEGEAVLGLTGTAQITSSSRSAAVGIPAGGGETLAVAGPWNAVFRYKAGTTLADGTAAAGCRIGFPASKTSAEVFTTDGWTLFDSVIDHLEADCGGGGGPTGETAVLVVKDPANLSASDTAIQTRLGGLGLTVTVMDDDAVNSANVDGHDVVYVSTSVSSSSVNTKLNTADESLIVAKPYLYDDMHLTGVAAGVDYGTVSTDSATIVDPGHPLAAGLVGTVQITNSPKNAAFGVPTASADVVATVGGQPGLFEYDVGDLLADGTTAAGCRIGFPVAKNSAEIFTADGWTLFDAAVAQAMAGC